MDAVPLAEPAGTLAVVRVDRRVTPAGGSTVDSSAGELVLERAGAG